MKWYHDWNLTKKHQVYGILINLKLPDPAQLDSKGEPPKLVPNLRS